MLGLHCCVLFRVGDLSKAEVVVAIVVAAVMVSAAVTSAAHACIAPIV